MPAELRNVSVELRNVSVELRNVTVELRNVSVELRNVSVELRHVSVELRNVSVELRNVSLPHAPRLASGSCSSSLLSGLCLCKGEAKIRPGRPGPPIVNIWVITVGG